jgi:hypothetical protein
MINPGLPEPLWTELDGRLWHATGHRGLAGIAVDGFIRVGNRYNNSICRQRGAVSLFDFGPDARDQDDLMRINWYSWLGPENDGRCAIWLEIDRKRSADRVMSPKALLEIVRNEQLRGRFFVGVEACHKGPIATSAIVGAIIVDSYNCSLFRRHAGGVPGLSEMVASFLESLPPPPPEPPLVRALREARERSR